MNKQNVFYPYNGILFTLKWKESLMLATTWTNPEDIMPNEISQSKRDKCCVTSLTCVP